MPIFPVVNGVEVLMAPPPGYTVNFDHPQQQHAILAYVLSGLGMTMSTLFFVQYMYVKLCLMRACDVETVLLVLAWITGAANHGLMVSSWVVKTLGVHVWEMSLDKYNLFNKVTDANSINRFCHIYRILLSLVLFYRHLSPQIWWKRCAWAIAALIICYNTAILFAVIFTCHPISKHWDARMTGGSCGHPVGIYMTTATMGIVTDLVLLIMPIPMVWGLQMPKRQKIGVIMLLFIGIGTLLTAVIRLTLFIPALYASDSTWDLSPSQVLILPEASLLVTCPCLTTLRRFFAHVAPKVIGLRGSSAGYTSNTTAAISGQNPYRTVGSHAGKKRKVDEFGFSVDEEVFHMETIGDVMPTKVVIEAGKADLLPKDSSTQEVTSSCENLTWDPRLGGDDLEPERAIVQTRTVTVEYEK
ncbi:hypothetical protein ACHAPJ_009088 [Fusarium lateritium]